MKRGFTMMRVLLLGGSCLTFLGCAGNNPPAQDPSSSNDSSDSASSETARGAHSLDVGMEFKDKNENQNARANHEAPPTSSWKPVEKDKAAPPLPKKGTATAAR
jgi:hypothetical protein